jgi:hypothetical protein
MRRPTHAPKLARLVHDYGKSSRSEVMGLLLEATVPRATGSCVPECQPSCSTSRDSWTESNPRVERETLASSIHAKISVFRSIRRKCLLTKFAMQLHEPQTLIPCGSTRGCAPTTLLMPKMRQPIGSMRYEIHRTVM